MVGKPSVNPIDVHVGTFFRTCRLQDKMSDVDMARLLGVSVSDIEGMEDGVQRISVERLALLCACFSVKPEQVYRGLTIAA